MHFLVPGVYGEKVASAVATVSDAADNSFLKISNATEEVTTTTTAEESTTTTAEESTTTTEENITTTTGENSTTTTQENITTVTAVVSGRGAVGPGPGTWVLAAFGLAMAAGLGWTQLRPLIKRAK